MLNSSLLDMHMQTRLADDRQYLHQAALEREAQGDGRPRRRWLPTLPSLRGRRTHQPREATPRTAVPQT